MRSRNNKARNEMNDRGAVTRSRRGNKVDVERKVGDHLQWRATGQSEGNSCVFKHGEEASGNGSMPRKQKERFFSPAPNSKAIKDGIGKSKYKPLTRGARSNVNGNTKNPSCSSRHPPTCRNYNSNTGCSCMVIIVVSGIKLWRANLTRSRRKEVRKDQLVCRKNWHKWIAYLSILIRRSLFFYGKKANWDIVLTKHLVGTA